MTTYDPNIIRMYAEKLYSRAFFIVLFGTLMGASCGAIPGLPMVKISQSFSFVWLGMGIGGFVGFVISSYIAFGLKLKAQLALCQVQIEENTRIVANSLPDFKSAS